MVSERNKEVIDTRNIVANNCAAMLVGESHSTYFCCNSTRNMGRADYCWKYQLMATNSHSAIAMIKALN
jgi:hypothetical protein